MAADRQLDLEERLARVHRGLGCAIRSRQELLSSALLFRLPGQFRSGCLLAGLLGLPLAARGLPFLSALEHVIPCHAPSRRKVPRPGSSFGRNVLLWVVC